MTKVIVSLEAQSDLHYIVEQIAAKAGTAAAARYASADDRAEVLRILYGKRDLPAALGGP